MQGLIFRSSVASESELLEPTSDLHIIIPELPIDTYNTQWLYPGSLASTLPCFGKSIQMGFFVLFFLFVCFLVGGVWPLCAVLEGQNIRGPGPLQSNSEHMTKCACLFFLRVLNFVWCVQSQKISPLLCLLAAHTSLPP